MTALSTESGKFFALPVALQLLKDLLLNAARDLYLSNMFTKQFPYLPAYLYFVGKHGDCLINGCVQGTQFDHESSFG